MANVETENAQDRIEMGKRIRENRIAKKMKARTLAQKIGITPAALSRIENGEVFPSSAILIRISEALEVPLSALQPQKLDKYSPRIFADSTPINSYASKFNRKTPRVQRLITDILTAIFILLVDFIN